MTEKLEKLDIEGFGKNKKLSLKFSPNVTTIIGKNYKGKSWTLRALKWVMKNEPAGSSYKDKKGKKRISYVNWNSDKAKVKLLLDGGKKVVRTRSNTINTYRLSGKKEPYIAFGQGSPPDDIANLMNVSDINFRGVNRLGQHEPPFWFCETAGEVSRQLNSIIDLEIIDKTLANIDSEKRDTAATIKVLRKDLEKAREQRRNLKYAKERNTDLIKIEKLSKDKEEVLQKRTLLIRYIELVLLNLEEIEKQKQKSADIAVVLEIGKSYQVISTKIQKLSTLVTSAESYQQMLKNKPPDIKPLIKLKDDFIGVTNKVNTLKELIESVKKRKDEICQLETEQKDLQKELIEVTKGRCPVCGSPMKS